MSLPLTKIAKMVSLDIPIQKIALALGVTPAKITQLIQDDTSLQQAITVETAHQVQEDINNDITHRNIEKLLLAKIKDLIPDSDSLGEVTAALSKVHAVKQQTLKMGAQQAEPGAMLDLNLSHIGDAKINITISANNQIESINNRSMASMPYKATMDLIHNKRSIEHIPSKHLTDALEITDIETLAKEKSNESQSAESTFSFTEEANKEAE